MANRNEGKLVGNISDPRRWHTFNRRLAIPALAFVVDYQEVCRAVEAKFYLIADRRINALREPALPTGATTLYGFNWRDLNDWVEKSPLTLKW